MDGKTVILNPNLEVLMLKELGNKFQMKLVLGME